MSGLISKGPLVGFVVSNHRVGRTNFLCVKKGYAWMLIANLSQQFLISVILKSMSKVTKLCIYMDLSRYASAVGNICQYTAQVKMKFTKFDLCHGALGKVGQRCPSLKLIGLYGSEAGSC